MCHPSQPIGVFDSGVGGLTVARALRQQLPRESIVYLGDTARVPYGTKSPQVVQRYASKCGAFLVQQRAKFIIIACNTASAVAVEHLTAELQVPVLGVIEPGAYMAAQHSPYGKIGVIGTGGTIDSGRYETLIAQKAPNAVIQSTPCPLFVPFAEEGMANHPATKMVGKEYLTPMLNRGIDTLVLGCTHYPILIDMLQHLCGDQVHIINSATAVAKAAHKRLDELNLLHTGNNEPTLRFFATDAGPRFARIGPLFFGAPIEPLQWVDVG